MAEWSKATDCKSVSKTHVGSNPIFLKIRLHLINIVTKGKDIQVYINKNKNSYYSKQLNSKNLHSLFKSTASYRIYTNFYHYDNFSNKVTTRNSNLILIKFVNFQAFIEYFNKKFILWNSILWNSILWFEDSVKFVFYNFTKKYVLNLIGFFMNNFKFNYLLSKVLTLNFKRKRFFPLIRDITGTTFFNTSLGILAKYLQKGKFFTKKKVVFLLVSSLIRKMLLYSSLDNLILMVKRTPMYLQDILSTINNPVSSIYNNPYTKKEVNEFKLNNNFKFTNVVFTTTKPYGPVKTKNAGRLKRKITKKLVLIGRVTD